MKIMNPIHKKYSLDTMREIIYYCCNYPCFQALVVFADIKELRECCRQIPNVKYVCKHEQGHMFFDNQSKITLALNKDWVATGLRINALLHSNHVDCKTYTPYLVPYYNRSENEPLDINL